MKISPCNIILIAILQQFIECPEVRTTFRAMWNRGEKTNPHKMEVSNCTFKVVNGFLKEKCYIDNKWYFKCSNSYRFYRVMEASCTKTRFTSMCPNDTTFYQACGHKQCSEDDERLANNLGDLHLASLFGPEVAACGILICKLQKPLRDSDVLHGSEYFNYRPPGLDFVETDPLRSGDAIYPDRGFDCDDEFIDVCENTINGTSVDKYICDGWSNKTSGETVNSGTFHEKILCNKYCDRSDCEDEASCNNVTVGLYCRYRYDIKMVKYVSPQYICDGHRNCLFNEDEADCETFNETCLSDNPYLLFSKGLNISQNPITSRFLSPRQKCSVLKLKKHGIQARMCIDYRDQMNCTGSTLVSPMICNVYGYPTTISEFVICQGSSFGLCDDKIDNQCVEAESKCIIHKHKLCDGIKDCRMGHDEGNSFCKDPFSIPTTYCVRKLSQDKLERKLLQRWVLDGVSDCRNSVDEAPEYWTKVCGYGLLNFYTYKSAGIENCSKVTQLKCPLSSRLLNLDRICSGNAMDNCDAEVCITARKEFRVYISDKLYNTRSISGAKRTLYCLPGLQDLQVHAGNCSEMAFLNRRKVLGMGDISVVTSQAFALSHIACSEIFGELYVYLTCVGLCGKSVKGCPLNFHFALQSWTCLNYPTGKTVLSLGDDGKLAMGIVQKDSKSYSQEIFNCENGHCTTFDKICNLVDDCGDLSDEKRCLNNFECNITGEYIPLTSKCDGKFDCFDYSDECNDECNNQVTMFDHISYEVIAWIFGLSATALNTITLFHGFVQYTKLKTETAMVNKVFVLLITFGDLLQGIFLLVLSIGEQFFNKSTCVTQFEWTTSGLCTFLGVLSTIGSLVSIYSMTVLSIIRAVKVLNSSMVRPKENLSRKKVTLLSLAVLIIIIISTLISILPIISYEDYFVEKLIYDDNPLLVGAPDKMKHLRIVDSYYGRVLGRFSKTAISWREIRNLIKDLFANNDVTGRSIDFYGSNGFCLFSYFVRKETTFRWFSISILTLNFLCVLVIVVSYAIITVVSLRSSKSVSNNSQTEKNYKKLQRKITLIIMTDILTWLPFIIVCIVNYTGLVDTSSWYSLFCVFFLRINSIINPIGIYDESIFKWIKNVALKLKSRAEGAWSFLKNLVDHKEIMNQNVQVMEMVEMPPENLKKQ